MPRPVRGQEPLFANRLFYGDNLRILRIPANIERESVDLIYLDPPFKPNEKYNVLFRARGGTPSEAQVRAMEDTWHWGRAAAEALADTKENAPQHVARTLEAMRTVLNESDMFAYLCMMAPRLVELYRVLKPTGTIYLHCDPAAAHYLKVLMDAVFQPENFLSEVTWKRSGSHNSARRFGPLHDTLLVYVKSASYTWNPLFQHYDPAYIESHFKLEDERGRYQPVSLTGPGIRAGDSGKPWRGFDPTPGGRHWQPPSMMYQHYEELIGESLASLPMMDRLNRADAAGLIYWPKKKGGIPRFKQYASRSPGLPLQDVWTDIDPLNSQAQERLGYPTQKPVPLLKRIIQASTNEGQIVLDPFCGCGTTIAAAEELHRYWRGIDIDHEAIRIIRNRLGPGVEYKVYGDPESTEAAEYLAAQDPYQFQWWAVRRLGAHEVEWKKGADRGIDGRLILNTDQFAEAVISVKAGHTGPAHIRELHGTMDRENALIGVLVTLGPATKAMRSAAADAGGYSDGKQWYPRIQVLTASDIIAGKQVEYPTAAVVETKTVRRGLPNSPLG